MMGKDFVPSSGEIKRDYILEMFGVNALPQVADIENDRLLSLT